VVFVANFLFMIWWFCLDRLQAVGPDGSPTTKYDAISLEITILGVLLAAMAIGLGIAAVFGYTALRDHMLMKTEELINQRFQSLDPKGGQISAAPRGPQPPGNDAAVAAVTEG